jgi:FkbM family methyltransferase
MFNDLPNRLRRKVESYHHQFSLSYWPAERPNPRAVDVLGFRCFVYANETVGRSLALGHRFESLETDFFRRNIRPTDVCFDVGANTGYFTTLFSALATRGSVHAFEPVPANAHLLAASVECNRFTWTKVNASAVGAQCGTATFARTLDSAYSSLRDTGRDPVMGTYEVEITTIDAYAAREMLPRIDVIKVDVEGAEGDVALGAKAILSDPARRPRLVMLELVEQNQAAFGQSAVSVVQFMASVGYAAHRLAPDCQLTPATAADVARCANFFFVPVGA